MHPRSPRHLIARGAVEVIISSGKVVITDEYGLILVLHEARAVLLRHHEDIEIFGELNPEPIVAH